MKAFDEYYASEADLKKPADADADFDSDPSNEPIDRRFRRLLSPYAFNDVTVTEMLDIVRQLKRTICAHVWRCLTIFAFGAALAFDLAVLHTHFEPLPFDGWTLIAAPGHAIGGRGLGVAAASAAGSPLPYAAQLQLHHVVEASCSAALATYGWFGREPFAHWLMVPWLLKALSAWLARLFEVRGEWGLSNASGRYLSDSRYVKTAVVLKLLHVR